MEQRTAAVVVDAEATADVKEFEGFKSHLLQLSIVSGCFAGSSLDGLNVRYLATDMKVDHLDRIGRFDLLKEMQCFHQIDGRKAKLCRLATRRGPDAGALGS